MRVLVHSALVLAVGFAATLGHAEEPSQGLAWPQRTVRLITPFPAGSGIDVAARFYADRLADRWGQSVVVENRPGGDGIIGVAAFVNQHDDHTLLFAGSAAFTVNPVINDKLPYDADRDVVPISSAADIFIAVTASNALKATTLAELVDAAKRQPGKLNWHAGPGLPQYVFAAFLRGAGLDMTSVSYRQLAPALQDLREGRIHLTVQSITAVRPLVQAGQAVVLAVASRSRAPFAPDIPTVVESGHPELVMDSLCGLFGWRDMPGALRDRIASDMRAVAADAGLQERLARVGEAANASTSAEFAAYLQRARQRISEMVRVAGAKTAP